MNEFSRFFVLDGEWNAVHLPERPNGFGVFLIGEGHHFVEERSSFWMQHTGRSQILKSLLHAGYTVFYSNLHGAHWGNEKAVTLAKRLYYVVRKQEILNEKIHILTEGMGALVALRLIKEMDGVIRSCAMINPCLSLRDHIEQEKDNKFFFKRLARELKDAYGLKIEEEIEALHFLNMEDCDTSVPIKIWEPTTGANYNAKVQSKVLEHARKRQQLPIEVVYHMIEKRYALGAPITKFFHHYENVL